MSRTLTLAAALLVGASVVAAAAGFRIPPWKDELFAYPAVIATQDDGAHVVVDYQEMRDINGRDAVPERQAQPQYVKIVYQTTGQWEANGARLKYVGVGKTGGSAKAVVIYIHGIGGNRFQGANQWTFGGNFNRLMNMMAWNGGAYISPDVIDFETAGRDSIKALIREQARVSPGAAIFVACGSQGGLICWQLAADAEAAKHLGGLLLLGSGHDNGFLKSPAFKARVPVYIGHGDRDVVFKWEAEEAFYRSVRKADPDYPIRFVLFRTGTHGTPIRMTDWRLVLNWMLAEQGG